MLGKLLGGFITILVGVNLLAPISDSVYAASRNSTGGLSGVNVTGSTLTIAQLVPLFFALGIMSSGVAITVSGLKNAGVM